MRRSYYEDPSGTELSLRIRKILEKIEKKDAPVLVASANGMEIASARKNKKSEVDAMKYNGGEKLFFIEL